MATQLSNRFKAEIQKGTINLDTDTIRVALMAVGFTFDRAAHNVYGDISASELATNYGYTKGDASNNLANSTVTEDDVNHVGKTTFNNISWLAAGGAISSIGAVVYKYHASDPMTIVGYIDFNGTQTVQDGGTFTIAGITIALA